MTDEEINRKFEVVADHMTTLAVGLQELTTKVDRLSDKVDRTADSVNALLAIAEIHDREIKELGAAVRVVDERQRETDDRLNALINTVERYITGRNRQG
jgi:uncharacterized protein YoxC